jgi:drug/metabolite transporter (DMT)-like permease
MLLTPIVSGVMAYLLEVDAAPGLLAWIGGAIMLIGCFLTIRVEENYDK